MNLIEAKTEAARLALAHHTAESTAHFVVSRSWRGDFEVLTWDEYQTNGCIDRHVCTVFAYIDPIEPALGVQVAAEDEEGVPVALPPLTPAASL